MTTDEHQNDCLRDSVSHPRCRVGVVGVVGTGMSRETRWCDLCHCLHPSDDQSHAIVLTPMPRGDWIATVAKAHKGANERTQEWRCAGCNAFRITDGTLPAPCYYCNHRGAFDD